MVPKLDSLIKHSSLKKCLVVRPRIVIGEYFLFPSNRHVKNENVYGNIGQFSVIDQLQNGGKVEKKKKCAICYIVAPTQAWPPNDKLSRVQTTFPIFEGGELPSKTLVE